MYIKMEPVMKKYQRIYCILLIALACTASQTTQSKDIKTTQDRFIQQCKETLSEKIIFPKPEKSTCPFSVIFSGYVKYEALFDSRQIVGFREDQVLLYPARRQCDVCGRDINDKGHANMLAIESRLRAVIIGPDVLDAQSLGVLEGDFIGVSDATVNTFRLRNAFAHLDWQNISLLAGQYWHPLFVPECYPDTISFNSGIPIEQLAREPQIRFTPKVGRANLILAAISQLNFENDGPQGLNSKYARDAVIPNLHAQLQIPINSHVVGIGIDYKRLVPRLVTDKNYKVTESINSTSALAYIGLNWPTVTFNTKVVYAQNLTNADSISGYAVTCINPTTDERQYTNLQSVSFWIDTAYKKKVEPGLFAGYVKNIGAQKTIIQSIVNDQGETVSLIYAAGQEDVDYVLRISPRIRWFLKPVVFAAELEYTRASFGTVTNSGKVTCTYPVNNTRLQLAVFYCF